MVELGVLDIQEILLGCGFTSVPGTRVITPFDTSKVFGLLAIDCLLNHPVCPQAISRAADDAGDGGAVNDLRIEDKDQGFSTRI